MAVVYFFERRVCRQGALPILRVSDLASGVLIGIAIFALSNLSFVSTATPFSGRAGWEVFYIRTLVDLAGYAILFAQFKRIQQSATERELASIQASLDAQQHQYLAAKEDMEQVARAHHDLKHQVEAIRAELDPGRAAASFAELESSIEQIGQQYHSGNPVLDVILTTIKPDTVRRGWGVKSIQWTARKYGGQAVTDVADHWFTLTVLLPSTNAQEDS